MKPDDKYVGSAADENDYGIHWDTIFNAISHPAIILDRNHRIIAANSASIRLTGMAQDAIVGKHCFEAFHRSSCGTPFGCPMEKMLKSGGAEAANVEMEAFGGIFHVSCTPILAEDGTIDKIIHIATDITAHKAIESSLQEQRSFTDSLVRNSTIAMFVLDSNHQVQVWNKACEKLTGFSRTDMIGSDNHWKAFYEKKLPTLADVVLDGDFSKLPECFTNVSRSTHNPNGYKVEGWFARIDGKDRYLLIETAPIYDRQGNMTHVLETITDLSESKSLEEQLRHAQKIESIGHLAGGIAHEFNNILSVILGYGQVMAKGLEPDSTRMHDLDQILNAAERAAVLTKGLLAFSRKQHVSLKNLDVNVLVHTTLKSFSRIMGDDIMIRERLDVAPLIINADQALMTQVFMNLMSNARDAMPNGGELHILTQCTVLCEPLLTPFCSIPIGKYAQVSLTDNGQGMDEETVEKIFEPFFTTKDVGKGTGLGLSVVYGIISQHNGYICVKSTPGQKTTFDLYFPLVEQQNSIRSATEFPAVLQGGSETILLADDDPILLKLFSQMLLEVGYEVITATDGVDAIEKFIARQDDIKLLILDAQMPRKSGFKAYKEIKQIRPECRALFISGYNEEQFQGDLTLEEGTELMTKPFALVDLAARVREVLNNLAS